MQAKRNRDVVLRLLEEAGVSFAVHDRLGEPVLTTGQAAALLRCSDRTIRKWADDGKILAIRTLGGHRRFRESEVMQLLKSLTTEATRS